MNCMSIDPDATLVDLVAFKWLMAGRGWWVDLSRLQRDVAYAGECARRARASGLHALEQQGAALLGSWSPSAANGESAQTLRVA
ncbi:hypothetical protein [Piscinibacter sp. XHJ-5]|uniref:hypothetical protein n=1 Tax=Piscinibacter sp. XHJ-5 TaxID=3037797 RepID=UPI002452BEEF|nr:hypothetical protein [Piscinibacter sp. XHJ-5]